MLPANNNRNLKGLRIPQPKGPASLILEPIRDIIWKTINCFWNPSIKTKFVSTDGTQTVLKDADIQMSPLGWTAMIDLTEIVAGSSGTESVTRYRYKDDLGACLKCRTWDGTTEGGTDIYIAKKPEIRNTVSSDVKNGVTYSYSYSLGSADTNGNHYLVRTVSGSDSSSEVDDIEPPYIYNCDIYAITIPSITLDSHACTLMDLSGREWAEQ